MLKQPWIQTTCPAVATPLCCTGEGSEVGGVESGTNWHLKHGCGVGWGANTCPRLMNLDTAGHSHEDGKKKTPIRGNLHVK